MKPYQRPYCSNCKVLWGKQSIWFFNFKPIVYEDSYEGTSIAAYVAEKKCPMCGGPVLLKSFNPWRKILGGIGILLASCAVVFIRILPIIWIGGFIWGFSMIAAGISTWSKVQSVDKKREEENQSKPLHEDKNYKIITCGDCYTQMRVKKGQGVIKIKCPKCSNEHKVQT